MITLSRYIIIEQTSKPSKPKYQAKGRNNPIVLQITFFTNTHHAWKK